MVILETLILLGVAVVLARCWFRDRYHGWNEGTATASTVLPPNPVRHASGGKAREPPVFSGVASEFREWVFAIELAMCSFGIPDGKRRVDFAAGFLAGNARLWMIAAQDAGMIFSDWPSLKTALAGIYGPLHEQEQTRLKLLNLSQGDRSIQDYIGDFTRLSLLIPDLDEHTRAMIFINGLHSRIRTLALREHPTTLSAAFRAVQLVDLPSKYQPWRPNAVQSAPEHDRLTSDGSRRLKRLTPDDRERLLREGKCFKCRQAGHRASDCSRRHPNDDRQ